MVVGGLIAESLDRCDDTGDAIGFIDSEIKVEEDPTLFRPSDIPILIGDATRFKDLTGWQPAVEMKETLRRLLDYWRGKQGEMAG